MAQDFMNALQAMSNSAAGTVSGPVDGIAWLLRKAGIPVPQNALGGSDWMRSQGLMAPVEQGAGQVLGETAGLLSPALVAAKAPQIAGGLLAMGRNALAPRTLGTERGVLAWHGTPADDFDKFSLQNFGKTDEGWLGKGVYGADSPVDASAYASRNGTPAGVVYRVDMDIKKPLVIDWDAPNRSELLGLRRSLGNEGFSKWLAENGYDGVQFLGPKTATNAAGHRDIQWMALDPAAVKQVPVSAR
jgi:hypothetical protein